MQTTAMIVMVYGVLVLVGGVMGFVKAHSKPSLIAGLVFGGALQVSGVLMWLGVQSQAGTLAPPESKG